MAAVSSAAATAAARIGAALSDAQYFESSMVRPEDIRRQLDSRSTKDKLDAMKRVIALISLGKDASMFFPDVVKNVVASSLDVKKLVYLYLVHYAEHKQDLALLAINSFQKDLSDPNQHIRALSLRVLSSIRVKVILQVVILAINNATKDSSAYVRKSAAHAISKVCALDVASMDMLLEPLQSLIGDRSPQVLGSAIAAYDDVCPQNWTMIHPHYRRICSALCTMEPWGQIAIIQMLLRYARIHFANPYKNSRSDKSFRNPDLSLLLESVDPLFMSLNNGVVASAISTFFHLGTADEFRSNAVKPLMRLVATENDAGQAVALHIASAVTTRFPDILIPYVSEFYVSSGHSAPIRNLRMKVLLTICATAGRPGGIGSKPDARRMLLAELKDYLFRADKHLAASAARAIGCLATAHPASTLAIVRVLSSVVGSANNPVVVSESIAVLRRLLQRHPTAQAKALPQLIAMLLSGENDDTVAIRDPAARSSIIWLIAEFYDKVQSIATEALRLLARGFANESSEVKVQILNLAAKIVVWNTNDSTSESATGGDAVLLKQTQQKLLEYVISCARYDRDYDVRDKARIMHALFVSNPGSALFKTACAAYLSRKPVPATSNQADSEDQFETSLDSDVIIGSMAHVLTGRRLFGFRPLEPWAEADSNGTLREPSAETDVNTTQQREYIGVGNTPLPKKIPSMTSDPISWLTSQINLSGGTSTTVPRSMQGVSSDGMHGSRDMFTSGGLASNGMSYAPSQKFQSGLRGSAIMDIDPENFYGEAHSYGDDEEETDDDDTEGESNEDEDDDDIQSGPVKGISTGLVVSSGEVRHHMSGVNADSLAHSSAIGGNIPTPNNTGGNDSLLIPSFENSCTVSEQQPSAGALTKMPTSEYDLDALLGGVNSDSPFSGDTRNTLASGLGEVKDQSPWSRVCESWDCGNLEVDACYLRSILTSDPDITPVMFRVCNRGKNELSHITFKSENGDNFYCQETVSSLISDESKELNVSARFKGKTSGVKFGIYVQGEVFGYGELKPSIGYVVRPRPGISPGEFSELEKTLTGMFASESSLTLSEPRQNNDWIKLSSDLRDRSLEMCFLSHIKTSMGGTGLDNSERFSIVFAGYLPASGLVTTEQRPVLVRVTVRALKTEFGCDCTIWIGCEDVLFSATLMRLYRTILISIDEEGAKC